MPEPSRVMAGVPALVRYTSSRPSRLVVPKARLFVAVTMLVMIVPGASFADVTDPSASFGVVTALPARAFDVTDPNPSMVEVTAPSGSVEARIE